jgi:hypothetical protein
MAYKEECDEDCFECGHYRHARARLTADPYYSTSAEVDCDLDWECPYLEEYDEEMEEEGD